MRLLLDTHIFLWFISGNASLSTLARTLILDPSNRPLLSMASLWEMAIKASLGKLRLSRPFDELIPQQIEYNGIDLLPIQLNHTAAVAVLPFYDHRDPFDRLLVAQSMVERIPLVSADSGLDVYPINRLW